MSSESEQRRVRASKGLREHLFLKSRLSKFGRAAIALWPDNAPKIIAERAGISIRNANQIMRGQRRVTARAALVINAEIVDEAVWFIPARRKQNRGAVSRSLWVNEGESLTARANRE